VDVILVMPDAASMEILSKKSTVITLSILASRQIGCLKVGCQIVGTVILV
jgi:hypothetical protein